VKKHNNQVTKVGVAKVGVAGQSLICKYATSLIVQTTSGLNKCRSVAMGGGGREITGTV
jgi:hypothetical protein